MNIECIIKKKDGTGWVKRLVPRTGKSENKTVEITQNIDEALILKDRRTAKNMLRKNRIATSNFTIDLLMTSSKELEFEEYVEYGE